MIFPTSHSIAFFKLVIAKSIRQICQNALFFDPCIEKIGWHVEKIGWHIENRGWHIEKIGWHIEKRGWHIVKRGWHTEKIGRHIEKRGWHIVKRGWHIEKRGWHIVKRGWHTEKIGYPSYVFRYKNYVNPTHTSGKNSFVDLGLQRGGIGLYYKPVIFLP